MTRNILKRRAVVACLAAALSLPIATASASAFEPSNAPVANYFLAGAEGGITITEEVTELGTLTHFSIPVSYLEDDFALYLQDELARGTWGASFATSRELFQLMYEGRAHAAGNIFAAQRIIQVCIWYTRSDHQVSGRGCSYAESQPGWWQPGPTVTVRTFDDLRWGDRYTTRFNISTLRVTP